MEQIDYLCVGHVTRDLTPAGPLVGGTATYSSRTAQALGLRAAVVTSAEPNYDLRRVLPDIPLARVPAAVTTTFENIYTPAGRQQVLHSTAGALGLQDVPATWCSPAILHLGPMAHEVDPELMHHVGGQVIGLTPQGWHREWDGEGRVGYCHWPAAADFLPLATAVVVSREDIRDDETWVLYRDCCRLLVVTDGPAGAEVQFQGQRRHFPAVQVDEVDPTGVGDIFAAAFFVRLWETNGDPWEAARFATAVAAPTVARRGLDGIPTPAEVRAARGQPETGAQKGKQLGQFGAFAVS